MCWTRGRNSVSILQWNRSCDRQQSFDDAAPRCAGGEDLSRQLDNPRGTAPGIPIVWDEGEYLFRAQRLIDWFRLSPIDFSRDAGGRGQRDSLLSSYTVALQRSRRRSCRCRPKREWSRHTGGTRWTTTSSAGLTGTGVQTKQSRSRPPPTLGCCVNGAGCFQRPLILVTLGFSFEQYQRARR